MGTQSGWKSLWEESYFCDWWSGGHGRLAELAGGEDREGEEPAVTGQRLCARCRSPSG